MTEKDQGILSTYYKFKHPVALFIHGMHNFCFQSLPLSGIREIETGFEMGSDLCQYALGILLLSVDNMQGAIYLRRCFNTLPTVTLIEFRDAVRRVALQKFMHFAYPTTLLCWKMGPKHWHYNQIIPIRQEEETITCVNCKIRIELSKLIHHSNQEQSTIIYYVD